MLSAEMDNGWYSLVLFAGKSCELNADGVGVWQLIDVVAYAK